MDYGYSPLESQDVVTSIADQTIGELSILPQIDAAVDPALITSPAPQIDAVVDPARGVDFLLQVFGPTTVVAIHAGTGGITAIWLDESTKDRITRWVSSRNQTGHNIYFHPNKPRDGLKKKATKGDIALIRASYSDQDCDKNGLTMVSGWALITALPLEPTRVIASGGGFHPYYLRREPLPATPEIAVRVEAVNTCIAALTRGDKVQNVDRIMRVPFTTNYPDATKLARGRTICTAGVVVGEEGPRYTLEELEAAFLPARVVPFPGRDRPTTIVPVDDPIPGTPPALARQHTAMTTAAQPQRDNSRSGEVQRIAGKMRREGKTEEEFYETIKANPNPDIVAWYKEKGIKNNDRELGRAWKKAASNSVDNSNVSSNGNDWFSKLKRSENGKILPVLANVTIAFREAPAWQGKLWYDEFQLKTVIRGPLPWPHLSGNEWTDAHDVCAAEWLQNKGIMVRPDVAGQAAEKVARERPFNPLREYLDGLVWDGVSRLGTWVIDYLGAKDTPYHRAVGAKVMIAAVARPTNPGCQCRNVPILEGPQDLGKSKAIRTLSYPYYTDDVAALGTKDAAMQVCGMWVAELAELSALNRSEVNSAKAFASRQTDRFRPPYGRRVGEFPRQGVLWGTSNNEQYLRDETGGTRWWPIRCTFIDIPGLAAARDQLWAEAVHRYRAGEKWWIDDPKLLKAAKTEQDARYQTDAWRDLIETFVTGKASVTVAEILSNVLYKSFKDWTRGDEMRVSACLVSMGWGRALITRTPGAKQQWCYVEPRHGYHPSMHKRRRNKPKKR